MASREKKNISIVPARLPSPMMSLLCMWREGDVHLHTGATLKADAKGQLSEEKGEVNSFL